ncbi:YncE family protein [Planctomycetota bacterium]
MRLFSKAVVFVVAMGLLTAGALAQPLLYTGDTDGDTLHTLSLADGSATLVGSLGAPIIAGLAYDAGSDILYGVDTGTNKLYSIDRTSGAATEIGPFGGPTLMHGLAFDSQTGTLYGAYGASAADNLYTIDTTTGAATFVGDIHHRDVIGLAFHPTTNVLYGVVFGYDYLPGDLLRISTTTGHGVVVAQTGDALTGLAFHPATNVLYAVDNGAGDSPDALYTIDISTGATTLVGLTGLGNNLGLAFVPDADVIPEPATLSLLTIGGLGLLRRRRRR